MSHNGKGFGGLNHYSVQRFPIAYFLSKWGKSSQGAYITVIPGKGKTIVQNF